jgi:hypothetical protein
MSGTGWEEIAKSNGHTFSVTQWSITSGIDDNIGATIVAAGSIYTRPNDHHSGGSGRQLLYFLRGADTITKGTMETLAQTSERPISAEDTEVTGPNSTSIVVSLEGIGATEPLSINYDANFVSLEPGTFVMGVAGTGLLAEAGLEIYNTGGGDFYRLIPTDGSLMVYGDDSFIMVDGSSWSVSFIGNWAFGDEIYISYDYNATVVFFPTYVSFYHNALIMASTYEDQGGPSRDYIPWRIRHTTQGDITKTFFRYYQDVAVNDITPIIQMRVMETVSSSLVTDYLYIYKQDSIVRAQYNQQFNISPDVIAPFMSFETAHTEGLEAVRTLVNAGGLQLYLGLNDVYMFNGTQRKSMTFNEKTGSTRIKKLIFDNLDLLFLNKCFGVYDEINERYMLFIKTKQNNGDYPTDCFVYDMELQTWTRYTYPEVAAALNIDLTPNGAISDLVGPISGLQGSIDNLSGNLAKLVLLAMPAKSYMLDSSTTDKTEDIGINFFYDDTKNANKYMEPQDTLENGRMWWKWFDPDTDAEQTITWDGANYVATSGNLFTCTHPDTGATKPPETGWPVWDMLGAPQTWKPKLEYTGYGVGYDSYLITRDFVGSSLYLQDRTQLVYLEGKKGSIEVGINGNYAQEKDSFDQVQTIQLPAGYKRVNYSPDKTASWVRLLITLKEGAKVRWLQVFSITQQFTNN